MVPLEPRRKREKMQWNAVSKQKILKKQEISLEFF
jgi:predicted NAD/FAD-binding protein